MVPKPYHKAPGGEFLTNLLGCERWNRRVNEQEILEKVFGRSMIPPPRDCAIMKDHHRGDHFIRYAYREPMTNDWLRSGPPPRCTYDPFGIEWQIYNGGSRALPFEQLRNNRLEQSLRDLDDRVRRLNNDLDRKRRENSDLKSQLRSAQKKKEDAEDDLRKEKKKARSKSRRHDVSSTSSDSSSDELSRGNYRRNTNGYNYDNYGSNYGGYGSNQRNYGSSY